jgi:hypothetical protein
MTLAFLAGHADGRGLNCSVLLWLCALLAVSSCGHPPPTPAATNSSITRCITPSAAPWGLLHVDE